MQKALTILALANSIINSAITLITINDKNGKMLKITDALLYISSILDAVIHANPIPHAPVSLTHPAIASAAISNKEIEESHGFSFALAEKADELHATPEKPAYQPLPAAEVEALQIPQSAHVDNPHGGETSNPSAIVL